MKAKVIKQEIPEEISELGGASIRLVNKETVELETSIDEAKDQLCVVGDKLLIKGQFVGLFKSMVKGIERDGNARQLGDFLTLYPVPTGEFDLDKGWDPAVNGVRIRARLMNEMEIDISKWEFEDVTPGRQSFTLESVQAGSVTGVVALDSAVAINGRNLPLTAAVRVDYAVEEMGLSGSVAPAKVVSTATRLDIASDALAALNVPANDGKTIVFTVRGNFANAKISALLKYVAPPGPVLPVESADHVVKITGCAAFNTVGVSGEIEGQNLGFDEALGRGINKAVCTIGGVDLEWTNNSRSGIAATSSQFGFSAGQDLPTLGTYYTTMKILRVTDSGEEILNIVNAKVVVMEMPS